MVYQTSGHIHHLIFSQAPDMGEKTGTGKVRVDLGR
jgi:hypothetical protein